MDNKKQHLKEERRVIHPHYVEIGNNCYRLADKVYLVTTQAGFNSALYDVYDDCGYSRKEVREGVQTFPGKYPAFIIIHPSPIYDGRTFVEVLHPHLAGITLDAIRNGELNSYVPGFAYRKEISWRLE